MACIPPNPRRVGYIDPIHGPLDGPLYMGSHIHQHFSTSTTLLAFVSWIHCLWSLLSSQLTLLVESKVPVNLPEQVGIPKHTNQYR